MSGGAPTAMAVAITRDEVLALAARIRALRAEVAHMAEQSPQLSAMAFAARRLGDAADDLDLASMYLRPEHSA